MALLIFNISVFLLIIISLWPGSLLGFLLYSDWGQQPDIIENPFGTALNHFIYYFYVTLIGFFLSIILELLHFIVPNRSFQIEDLIANILGVLVAYSLIKIYLFFIRS